MFYSFLDIYSTREHLTMAKTKSVTSWRKLSWDYSTYAKDNEGVTNSPAGSGRQCIWYEEVQ